MRKQKKTQKNVRKNVSKVSKSQQSSKERAEKTMNRWGKVNFFMLALIFAYILGRDAGFINITEVSSVLKTIGEFILSAFVQVILESILAKVVNMK